MLPTMLIRDVIEELDTRRTQVMVEALIMEVDITEGEQFGSGFLYQNQLTNSRDESRRSRAASLGSATGHADISS